MMISRINAKGYTTTDRGLHQQLTKVRGEHLNRALIGAIRQLIHEFTLERGLDETIPGIFGSKADLFACRAFTVNVMSLNDLLGAGLADLNRYAQESFLFAAIQCQNPVIGCLHRIFAIIGVLGIGVRILAVALHALFLIHGHFLLFGFFLAGRGLLFLNLLAAKLTGPANKGAQLLADIRIICNDFRDDVPGHGKGFIRAVYFLFGVHIGLSKLERIILLHLLEQLHGQRLQSLFARNDGTCPPLRAIGQVQVLKHSQCGGCIYFGSQNVIQLSLLLYGIENRLTTLFQPAQIFKSVSKRAKLLIIHLAGLFFPISCNKGNRIPLINQFNDLLCNSRSCVKFSTKYCRNFHTRFLHKSLWLLYEDKPTLAR